MLRIGMKFMLLPFLLQLVICLEDRRQQDDDTDVTKGLDLQINEPHLPLSLIEDNLLGIKDPLLVFTLLGRLRILITICKQNYNIFLKLLYVNQQKLKVQSIQFTETLTLQDISKSIFGMNDFLVEEGKFYISSNTGLVQVFTSNFIEESQFVFTESDNLPPYKLSVGGNYIVEVNSKAIKAVVKGEMDGGLTEKGDFQVLDMLVKDDQVFLVLKEQGMVVYKLSKTSLTRVDQSKFFEDNGIRQPVKLGLSSDNKLLILDFVKGLFKIDVGSDNYELINYTVCSDCTTFTQLKDNSFIMATQTSLFYIVGGKLAATVKAYGVSQITQFFNALILSGNSGTFIDDNEVVTQFHGNYFVPLPQQVRKVQVVEKNVYILTNNIMYQANFTQHPAYLECLADGLQTIDTQYTLEVVGIKGCITPTNTTDFKYKFQITLVEPLVTSSNIAVIIGAVLGTLLAFLILSIVFYILYKKYKKDRSDAYTDIYKQEEVVIENNNK